MFSVFDFYIPFLLTLHETRKSRFIFIFIFISCSLFDSFLKRDNATKFAKKICVMREREIYAYQYMIVYMYRLFSEDVHIIIIIIMSNLTPLSIDSSIEALPTLTNIKSSLLQHFKNSESN